MFFYVHQKSKMAASVENSLTLNMDMNNQVNNAGSGEPQVHEWYNFILFANYLANLKKKKCIFVRQIMNKGIYYATHVDPHYLLYSGKDDRQYTSLFIFQYTHHVNIWMLSQCVVCLVTWLFCILFPCCQFQNIYFF